LGERIDGAGKPLGEGGPEGQARNRTQSGRPEMTKKGQQGGGGAAELKWVGKKTLGGGPGAGGQRTNKGPEIASGGVKRGTVPGPIIKKRWRKRREKEQKKKREDLPKMATTLGQAGSAKLHLKGRNHSPAAKQARPREPADAEFARKKSRGTLNPKARRKKEDKKQQYSAREKRGMRKKRVRGKNSE